MRIYVAIFIATLSTVCLPVPEEATLLAAGYAARVGRVALPGCIAACYCAILAGDSLAYSFGRFVFARILRTSVGRRLLPETRRRWAETLVASQGGRAIVIGRFLVGLRGFVYFAVGASRYRYGRFLLIDACAAAVDVTAVVSVGFAFGELRAAATPGARPGLGVGVDLALLAIAVLAVAGPLSARAWANRAKVPPAPP